MRLIRTIDRWLRDWTAAWNAVVGDELRQAPEETEAERLRRIERLER